MLGSELRKVFDLRRVGAGHWHFWKDENSGSNRLHPHEFRSRPNGQMFFGCVQLPFLLAFGLRLTSIWIYLVG